MKICLVQTKPVRGVIAANIASHLPLMQRAVAKGANTILFPELSLTVYEPSLAKTHAITTLLVNCVGDCEDGRCAGQSAVWNNKGEQLAQLDEGSEGLLLLNTTTGRAKTVAC